MPVGWEPGRGGCNCGSVIDLESRAAVPRMVARARELWDQGSMGTELSENDFLDERETSRRLIELAQQEDGIAMRVLDDALRALARGLLQMAVIASPDVVTLGGAAFAAQWPVQRLRRLVDEEASGYLARVLKGEMIKPGNWGNDAGMIGAAVLARALAG